MVKLVFILYRRPELTHEEFGHHWLETHAPLVKAAAGAIEVRRYVQSHVVPGAASADLDVNGGLSATALPDGVAELWWESAEAMTAAFGGEGWSRVSGILAADEAKFIDSSRSFSFLTEEHEIVALLGPPDQRAV